MTIKDRHGISINKGDIVYYGSPSEPDSNIKHGEKFKVIDPCQRDRALVASVEDPERLFLIDWHCLKHRADDLDKTQFIESALGYLLDVKHMFGDADMAIIEEIERDAKYFGFNPNNTHYKYDPKYEDESEIW